jgi:aspartyl-tRNA(Asn)/glutamyl-tRNA(Gln) amidotransferase subunit C
LSKNIEDGKGEKRKTMEVNEELIRHIAKLAKIELTNEEVKEFVPQLKEVFASFSKLQEVDVSGVEPSFHAVEIKNKLREDKAHHSLSQEEALRNAKQTQDGYFKAPRSV